MRIRSWTDQQLIDAVSECKSLRQVLHKLGLVEAGGNYVQIKHRIRDLGISVKHFTGKGWNKGLLFRPNKAIPLAQLLIEGSLVQSHKLKLKLFSAGLKFMKCELCGWSKRSQDDRLPLELDHINGKKEDNRIENLRVLCPNCHSLQLTHRGKNKKGRVA
jgi:Zn finger protein HypA/HybF involved in hydrogenase expression